MQINLKQGRSSSWRSSESREGNYASDSQLFQHVHRRDLFSNIPLSQHSKQAFLEDQHKAGRAQWGGHSADQVRKKVCLCSEHAKQNNVWRCLARSRIWEFPAQPQHMGNKKSIAPASRNNKKHQHNEDFAGQPNPGPTTSTEYKVQRSQGVSFPHPQHRLCSESSSPLRFFHDLRFFYSHRSIAVRFFCDFTLIYVDTTAYLAL